MATTTLPDRSDTRPLADSDRIAAHHTISVEPFHDDGRPEVHEAVVERDHGVVVRVWCCDADVCDCAPLDDVARAYAAAMEADYVGREVFR